MSNILSDDVRTKYEKAFATIRGIAEAFPEERWLEPHGDVYYIPSRIAYHLAVFIDGFVAGGMKSPDFREKLPFGSWHEGTAATLPDKKAFLSYYEEVVGRAQKVLEGLDDNAVTAPIEPERVRMGATQIGAHMQAMRELSAHSGELNKMLIENGKDDIWV